jgi:hypothetical protein
MSANGFTKGPSEEVVVAMPIYDATKYPEDVVIGAPIMGMPVQDQMPYPMQQIYDEQQKTPFFHKP